jgi:phenylacetate-coenzyme A ligase PaaK-like adenylate-forming protein
MKPYTWMVANCIFPIQETLKGHTTVAVRAELEDSQWWSPQKIQDKQLSRLIRLIESARDHVPYYTDLFSTRGLNISDFNSLEDLAKLPFLTKDIIRANETQLKSATASGLSQFNTGGSSGEPLIFFIGKERVSHDVAAKWRATRWWNVDIGDREIVVWGSPVELGAQDRMRVWRDRLMRTKLIPAFDMSEPSLCTYIDQIQKSRPKMLFGYPSSLAFLARFATKEGISLSDLGIAVCFVTSERLYDDQRRDIESAFNCPVANGYGSRDAGFIAHQCPSGNMHITAEDIIVEIIGPDDKAVPLGETGEIVVTHLATADYPFVRYRTGDMGALDDSQCDCGRGLPVLKDIQGRSTDFVVAADGTVMHGLALIYVLRQHSGIDQFKIVQESLTHTRVMIVATHQELAASTLTDIECGIKERLGQSVSVDIELVSNIEAEKSGKYRYIISKVVAS